MENLTSNPTQNKLATLEQVTTTIANLQAPTHESVQAALSGILTANSNDLQALMSFTGYYGLSTAENAFLSIDTSEIYVNIPVPPNQVISFRIPTVTVNVSLDGTTAASYPFDENASFDGTTLKIGTELDITLTRGYKNGALAALSGTVTTDGTSTSITASTYFNPVSLPVFVGNYKEVTTHDVILTVADASIEFDFGTGIENVAVFSYNPSMYVLEFVNGSGASLKNYTLMLGTSGAQGLACFITDGAQNDFAVTIP